MLLNSSKLEIDTTPKNSICQEPSPILELDQLSKPTENHENPRSQFGICTKCGRTRTAPLWCRPCEVEYFHDRFSSWTSGNKNIDNFIRETQLAATTDANYLEWIEYSRFDQVKYIAKGGFGSVYSAIWLDGPRRQWNVSTHELVRAGPRKVALKSLNDSNDDVSEDFVNEIKMHLHKVSTQFIPECFGITKDPDTGNYMIVMKLADEGDLKTLLRNRFSNLRWNEKLKILSDVADGLKAIHEAGIVHRDFHTGNILLHNHNRFCYIADMGLARPADKQLSSTNREVYGVLPYIAPEVLRRRPYTPAADIYSFAIVMWETAAEEAPFFNREHNVFLALDICSGERPEIYDDMPPCFVHLMRRCWNAKPELRPSIGEISELLYRWHEKTADVELLGFSESKIYPQFRLADEKIAARRERIKARGDNIHPKAVYTSRLLDFQADLLEMNSDDRNLEDNNEYLTRQLCEGIEYESDSDE